MTDLSEFSFSGFWRVMPQDADPVESREWLEAFDAVIDGSARDSIMKSTVKSALSARHKATETKAEMDATIERTVRTAK